MSIELRHYNNGLYLLAALTMIFLALSVAIQPLFLRTVLAVPLASAGVINANVQVVTEVLDLVLVGYLGYLSDRLGRVPIIIVGFVVAGCGAVLAPFSPDLAVLFGVGGIAVYSMARVIMSLGAGAVWPQLTTLVGDFSSATSRPRLMANTAFMTAFGATLVYAVLMQMTPHVGTVTVMLLTAAVAFAGAVLARGCLVWMWRRVLRKVGFPGAGSGISCVRTPACDSPLPRRFLPAAIWFWSACSSCYGISISLILWGYHRNGPAATVGLLIGLVGLVVLVSIPVWGRVIERFGRITALAAGMALSGVGLIGLGFIVNPFKGIIVLPAVILAAGQGGCLVAPQVLAIDLAPRSILGSVVGAFNVVGGESASSCFWK